MFSARSRIVPVVPFADDDEPLLVSHNVRRVHNDDEEIILAAEMPPLTFRPEKKRFVLLFVVMLLNISNGMNWITFSTITNLVSEFYKIDADWVNYLALVFPLATIPFGLIGIAVLDSMGLRAGILVGAVLNCAGAVLRYLSALPFVPAPYRYPALMGGQCLCAVAQPFILFVPTKLAGVWFAPTERAKANTAASMANPLGILAANFLSPFFLKGSSQHLPFLLLMYVIPAGVGFLLALMTICKSQPTHAPSISAAEEHQPFKEGIKMLVRNRPYWILALCEGTGVALFTAVTTLLQQVLCARGYSDRFAGACGAAVIAAGVIGAGVAGAVVDRTRKFEEVAKVALCLATLSLIAFSTLSNYSDLKVYIVIALALFGFFGFAMYPVSLEMAVESTYPVAEATSSGIILIVGQVLSLVLILAMQYAATPITASAIQTCSPETPMNYMVPGIIMSSLGIIGSALFVFGYKCQYRRLQSEEVNAALHIQQAAAANREWPYAIY